MPTLYLAGPINARSDLDCHGWRNDATARLQDHYTIRSPMARDYRGVEALHAPEIVEGDLADLAASDVVLVNAALGPSWGTGMEVREAYRTGKHVVAVVGWLSVSPWLAYHTHARFPALADACVYLNARAAHV
jgi:hypothetical protein